MPTTDAGARLRDRTDWEAVLHRCALTVAAERAGTWRTHIERGGVDLGAKGSETLRQLGHVYRRTVLEGIEGEGVRIEIGKALAVRIFGNSPVAAARFVELMEKETARQLSSGRMVFVLRQGSGRLLKNRDCVEAFDRCLRPGNGKHQVLVGERTAILYILGTHGADIPGHERVASAGLEDTDDEAVIETALKLWEPESPESTLYVLENALSAARCV